MLGRFVKSVNRKYFFRQAINALWKKVSNMQTIPENIVAENGAAGTLGGQDLVQDLTKTCSMLTNQVWLLRSVVVHSFIMKFL